MKILIPMAGKGKRFEDAGYSFPKPLIDINGKPMIQIIIENLNFPAEHIFLCQKEHSEKYSLNEMVARLLSIRKKNIENIELFLNPTIKNLLPNPLHLKDMNKAIDRTY